MAVAIIYTLFLFTTVVSLNLQPIKVITDTIVGTDIELDSIQTCPEYHDIPARFDVVVSKDGQNKFIVQGTIEIRETIDSPLKLEIEMHRCPSKDNPGSCEYYFTFRKDHICDIVKDETHWNYFRNGTDLPESCPYEAGLYTINGSTIDVRDFQCLPLFDSYWKISVRTIHNDKPMLCLKSSLATTRRTL